MLLLLLKLYAVQGLFVKYKRDTGASPINTLWSHQRTGRGGWGGCSPPSRQKNSIIRAKVVYRSSKETVKKYILLFNISIHLFSSRNSPNLLNYLGPTSRDGLLGVRTLSSAEGLGMIIKTALGLELRMISLAAMLIYVSSRVHVYLVDSSMSVEVS